MSTPTPMPTGAKLMAAVCFAVVGWVLANYYAMNMPDAGAAGPMREAAAVVGAIIGGYSGATYAQKIDPQRVRQFVIVVGFVMTCIFFYRTYLQ